MFVDEMSFLLGLVSGVGAFELGALIYYFAPRLTKLINSKVVDFAAKNEQLMCDISYLQASDMMERKEGKNN